MLEDIIKFLLPIVFTESVPYILMEHGLSYDQTAIISMLVMALKLFIDVIFIRLFLSGLGKILNRMWRLVKFFFWKRNILYIKTLSRKNSKVVEIATLFGKLSFIYQKPIKAVNGLKNRLVNWMVGVGALAIFVMSVVPAIPVVAATPVLAYIVLTTNRPWYQFNNWLFVALLVGSEIKIIYLVIGLYGL